MVPEITLDEFYTQMGIILAGFYSQYSTGIQQDPSLYPTTLTASDWLEQLTFYAESIPS